LQPASIILNTGDFIFLADDDLDDQQLLIEAIHELDPAMQVHPVNDGSKAISFLRNLPEHTKPCLIVLDYNLPELTGSEILNAINLTRKFEKVTKVVWSTSNSAVYKKECLDKGANAYLVKPSDVAGIQKIAQHMLDLCNAD
jgi:CheY-like chemotaxis protein